MKAERIAYRMPEVAEQLSISERTVRRLIKQGDLPAVRAGSATLIRVDDLKAYVASMPPVPSKKAAQS